MSGDKPCGKCNRFVFEDAYGYGWCLAYDIETKCDRLPYGCEDFMEEAR